MIKSFRHKGLSWMQRNRSMTWTFRDSGLHQLRDAMAGRWAISVRGNWRMTFEFHDGNAYVLDYEDYH